jgi:hypothetical protein
VFTSEHAGGRRPWILVGAALTFMALGAAVGWPVSFSCWPVSRWPVSSRLQLPPGSCSPSLNRPMRLRKRKRGGSEHATGDGSPTP